MIHIIINIGKEEHAILAELMADTGVNKRKRKLGRILLIIVMLVFSMVLFTEASEGRIGGTFAFYTVFLILLFVFFLFIRKYQVWRLKSYYNRVQLKIDKALLRREYYFSEEGIRILSEGTESKYKWDAIKKSFLMSHFYVLETVQGAYIIINENLIDENEKAKFDHLLREKGSYL